MIGLLCLFFAAEDKPIVPDEKLSMQRELMHLFYENANREFLQHISDNAETTEVCEWVGVICSEGKLVKLQYVIADCGELRLEFIPNSAHFVGIEACTLRCILATRQLPLESRCILLNENSIYGPVDLGSLPPKLVFINLSFNHISGTVTLADLPQGLAALYILHNNLERKTVYYGSLPETAVAIRVRPFRRNHRVKGYRPMRPEFAVDEQAIFKENVYDNPYQNYADREWRDVYRPVGSLRRHRLTRCALK